MQIGGLVQQVLQKADRARKTRQEVDRGWRLDSIDRAIIETITAGLMKAKRDYVYLKSQTILEFLQKFHFVDISERTLFYRLARLERLNYIRRATWVGSKGRGHIWKKTAFFLCQRAQKLIVGIIKFGQKCLKNFSWARIEWHRWREQEIRNGKTGQTTFWRLGNRKSFAMP